MIPIIVCVVWFGGLIWLFFHTNQKNKMRIGPWHSALKCDSCGCVDMRAHVFNSVCPRCGERRQNVVVARMNRGKVEVK